MFFSSASCCVCTVHIGLLDALLDDRQIKVTALCTSMSMRLIFKFVCVNKLI